MTRRCTVFVVLALQIFGAIVTPGLVLCLHDDGSVRFESEDALCCSEVENRADCCDEEPPTGKENGTVDFEPSSRSCTCNDVPLATSPEPQILSTLSVELPPPAALTDDRSGITLPIGCTPSIQRAGEDPPDASALNILVTTIVIRC